MALKLTGDQRYRTHRHWGTKLIVLQVEEAGTEPVWNGNHVSCEDVRRWRDAKLEDLTIFDVKPLEN